MEENTKALEIVCKHFHNECADTEIRNLRLRINRAHVQNHRLRKKAQHLTEKLNIEQIRRKITSELLLMMIRRMDSEPRAFGLNQTVDE